MALPPERIRQRQIRDTRNVLAGQSIPDEAEPRNDAAAIEPLMKLFRLFATGGTISSNNS